MSSSSSPCAACKIQRRKCTQECVFAPYFPPDQPQKFANVHKVFGASNVSKLLNELSASQREDAVNSLHYEAEQRLLDPVYGCVGPICVLQQRLKHLQGDLESARLELSQYIGAQAFLPMTRPPSQVPPQYAAYGMAPGGARPAYLLPTQQPPPPPPLQVPAPSHQGMFPMMRVGSGGPPLVIREPRQQHSQQLLPQTQQPQQVYDAQQLAAIAAAAEQQDMYVTYEQMQLQQQQQMLRLYGQGQQHQHQQELVRFNSAGGYEVSTSGNGHGFLNQIPVTGGGDGGSASGVSPSLALGNYDHAYHMQQQQQVEQQQQQLGELGLNLNQQQQQQHLGDLGINLNQQEQQQLGDLALNLNQQQQPDANQLEVPLFLEPLGPPESLQQQQHLPHRQSKSDGGNSFEPDDDC